MKKIKWLGKVTNEHVKKRTLLNNVLRIKANWTGPIRRQNGLLQDAIEGQMIINSITNLINERMPKIRRNKERPKLNWTRI